nr:BrnA antitoxin family protein [Gammaproteobacteria bacterium]
MKRKPEHIRQEDWDEVEIPELTEEDFERMRPAREVLPELLGEEVAVHLLKRKPGQRGPQKALTKQPVTLRLDRDVLAYFRAKGRGWQKHINEALRRIMAEGK